MKRAFLPVLAPALAIALALAPPAPAEEEDGVPEFTEEFLDDPLNVALGEGVWGARCHFCHGRSYPRAPSLRPQRYTPEWVYDIVTHGRGGMPGFENEFSDEERMAVAAYILSPAFRRHR